MDGRTDGRTAEINKIPAASTERGDNELLRQHLVPKLSEIEKNKLEGESTPKELLVSLKNMSKKSSPCISGFK